MVMQPGGDSPESGRVCILKLMGTGIVIVLGGSFHFGYQISLINPMADILQEFLEKDLTRTHGLKLDDWALRLVWATVAGLLFAGALLGAICMPRLMNSIGTTRSFLISSTILCLSFALAAVSNGVGIGSITTLQTVYLTEISPVKYRGLMGTMTGFSTSIGFVIASGVGLPQVFGNELWHWAYILEMLPSLSCIRKGRVEMARKCLQLYQPVHEVQLRMSEIMTDISPKNQSSYTGVTRLVRLISHSSPSRSALLICMLLNATVSFSGILAVSFFGTFLLQAIGFSEKGAALANCFASISGILGNFAGSFAVDKMGRRKLILGGLSTLVVLNVMLMALVFSFQHSTNVNYGYVFLAIFMVFFFAFSFGVGPMAWFLATELTTSTDRSLIQSLSVSCQYATCFLSHL
uniref:Major facilitator superfamily (MFS) profile domain-containing protein n=1 Tax=Ditylenchus dipsaci TaxID=166011 RepID=A0A915D663_9BILA